MGSESLKLILVSATLTPLIFMVRKRKGAMDQLELFELPNPCVGICQSNNRGYCVGCLRSLDERYNWHQKPVAERAKILKLLENRRIRRDAARLAGKPEQGLEADPTPDLFDF